MRNVNSKSQDFNNGKWFINPDTSIINGVDKKYWYMKDEVLREMTDEEKMMVDFVELDNLKTKMAHDVDIKTEKLILNGFTFDGKQFSLSIPAQTNWNSLKVAIFTGMLNENNFPYTITTLKNDVYQLQWEDTMSFFTTALGTGSQILMQGRILKGNIMEASSYDELIAIEDNR